MTDIRRIQITGGSSYMITLPKEWAESSGLKKNDPVTLMPQADGSLAIFPNNIKGDAAPDTVKTIDGDSVTDRVFLYRQLVGAYIAGHGTIEIRSEYGLSSMVTNVASSFVQTAIGLVIIEEDETHIIIRDLINQDGVKPIKSIERMKILVRNMLNDVLTALDEKDASLITDIDQRDREVDRLNWLISRQINIHLRDVSISRKQGADLCSVARCGHISKTLERIGDHAVVLAKELRSLIDDDRTNRLDTEIVRTGRDVVSLFSESVTTWISKDMMRANDCITSGERLVERSSELSKMAHKLEGASAIAADAISRSVRRVAEYSMDIAEMTINSAMD
ncbi:MAG: PhoU domain-containing protein [Candidatus Methanomethylophilaceae archaeon]|nr:PhoU domain-containing protein [Candidatus Methanomethylophilaceae archaeon]